MSKGSIFVVVCSLIVIGSFILSCFLLTTINPPKVTIDSIIEHRRMMLTDSETDEMGNQLINPHDSLAPFYRYATTNFTSTTKLQKSIFILPYTVRVSPPIEPTTSTDPSILYKQEDNDTSVLNSTISKISPVKGHRRSVHNYDTKVLNGNSEFIKLKIIDNYGQPIIEIKLNLDKYSKEKYERDSSYKLNIQSNEGKQYIDDLESINDANEIKIMPNDTIIIDSNNVLSKINSYTFKNKNRKESTISQTPNYISNVNNSSLNKTESSSKDFKETDFYKIYFEKDKSTAKDPIVSMSKKLTKSNNNTDTNDINNKTNSNFISNKNVNKNITKIAKKEIDLNLSLNNIVSLNNINNKTENYVQPKELVEAKKELESKAIKLSTHEHADVVNSTKANGIELRILFDDQTKSSYEVSTVENMNVSMNSSNS